MRNVMKAATLESKFPILSVEHDCIISKDADITVCYRVELPELFTVTQAEYEAIHSAWAKAVKVLPNYSIVHKQDFFIEESYTPELQKEDLSFLSRSFERHFNERPYLKHYCYLFLTKTCHHQYCADYFCRVGEITQTDSGDRASFQQERQTDTGFDETGAEL